MAGRLRIAVDWLPAAVVVAAALGWAALFAGLALNRHATLGSHAEDLGFTDQVIWNFLRGQWFRMSVYSGSIWNTEVDVARLARPDSLLAFHIEPMLLFFVPLYALGADARTLLVAQSAALAAGALPAFGLGRRWLRSGWGGAAVALAYLASPFGQWAALADFHTTALAAPLLLLAVERMTAGSARAAVAAAVLALTAREDVGLAVASLGLVGLVTGRRALGAALAGLGIGWTACCLLVIRAYSGGAFVFVERYPTMFGGVQAVSEALSRPIVLEYAATLLLSGGLFGLASPLWLLPAIPSIVLNVLSTSPWMASGKAHYSALVLPFVVCAAAAGLARLVGPLRSRPAWQTGLPVAALVASAGSGLMFAGIGPLVGHHVPRVVTERAREAVQLAKALPPTAGVSATSSLVPHLSRRARLYVFPAVEDADFVFVDVAASPAPTSRGDVYLRARALLAEGGWSVRHARDGLLLLARSSEADPIRVETLPDAFFDFARDVPSGSVSLTSLSAPRLFLNGDLELLGGRLERAAGGAIEPDGPRGVLRTVWRARRPLPRWARPDFRLMLADGKELSPGDLAALWWYPLDRWRPDETVVLDVPDVPRDRLVGWDVAVRPPEDQRLSLGELTLTVDADPWRLRLLGPGGQTVWEEAPEAAISVRTVDGRVARALRLLEASAMPDGGLRLVAETDDPTGRLLQVEARGAGFRTARLTITSSDGADIVAIGGSLVAAPAEQFVGLGERFVGVNQRGRVVDVWAEDRVLAEYGESTYAPLPLLLSSRGHGFALERFERSRFDLAANRPDRWSWEQEASSASILVSYGPTLRELVERHVAATGTPPLPPIWAFGVWKTAVGGQDAVLGEAARLRALGVPVSAVFAYDAVDHGANIGWPFVNFAGRRAGPYPDHAAFTAGLHRLGIKALNYFKADFHLDRPGYDVPAGQGFLARRPDGEPYVHPRFPVSWLDFTNDQATDWWGGLWRRALVDLGYDGGMLDVGEILPADARMADGTTGAQTHNRYPLLYARWAWAHASRARPDGDFVLFARSGAVGAQRYQSLQWPGDPRMEWQGPSGLQSLVPAALSFGLSGFPYWHAEVAGYVQVGLSQAEERELWLRWLQLATWSSTLRDHYGDHPTAPIDFWLDEGTIAAFRDAARIHSSLVPYLYSTAQEATRTGLPLLRFLPLEVPDDPRAWREEGSYFLGPSILVAPVIEPGATTRTVYLPAGDWVDFWTDTPYRGGQEVTVPAPLDGGRAPAFVRAGALLPLAPDHDSLVAAAEPGVRSYAGDLVIRVVPGGGPSSFTLYDGTRLSWDGEATLRVEANARPRSVELRAAGRVARGQLDGPVGELSAR